MSGLFRYGFLAHLAESGPTGADSWMGIAAAWRELRVGPLVLWLHPETRVVHSSRGDEHTILIGDVFALAPLFGEPIELASVGGDGLFEVLDHLSGRFALFAVRDGRVLTMTDPHGSRTVFYREDGGYAIASHAELIALAYGLPRDEAVQALVATRGFKALRVAHLPGDVTLWQGVHALIPNHFHEAGLPGIHRFWPRRPKREATFDAFFEALDAFYAGLAGYLADRAAVVSITGGIDSRTIIAGLKERIPLHTVTWTTFNFQLWETVPVTQVSMYTKLPHHWVNEKNDALDERATIGVRNSGEHRGSSNVVSGMGRLFGDDPRAVFVRGLGAGVYRGFHNQPGFFHIDSYDPDGMRRLFDVSLLEEAAADDTYRREVRSAFEGMCRRARTLQMPDLGFDPNDLFYWEHRMGRWASESMNAMDPAMPSLFGFNSRAAAETAMGVPAPERLSKGLFARVTRRYDAGLAALPFR